MMLNYLIAYLLVGLITSIGMCLWFDKGCNYYSVIGFFLLNFFFYPFTLAIYVQNAVFMYKHAIKCAWCGETVDFKNSESVQEHVARCQKHPTLTRIAELEKEISKLKINQIYTMSINMADKVLSTPTKDGDG